MLTTEEIRERLSGVFSEDQARVLAELIRDSFSQLVKSGDFDDLKEIVKEMAQAQQHTELRMEELAQAVRHTESRMEELVQAQQQTELAVQSMLHGVEGTRNELGEVTLSQRYALENEAQRTLPRVLLDRHGISVEQRLIRAEIGGEEIHLFGRGSRQGLAVLVVGEAWLRVEEGDPGGTQPVFETLARKVEAVHQEYSEATVVPVLVTHFARGSVLRQATERGVIVVQSYEW
jgi:hypothetical protein